MSLETHERETQQRTHVSEQRKPRIELDGVRRSVFQDRYARKGDDGKPVEHTPEEMWRRVARGIAEVEPDEARRRHWEERFYEILHDFKFVPGGRILAGAGTGHRVTFYNCYVIPSPEDSRQGILKSVSTMVEIMARGGGVGINLSTIRPKGSYVKGVNGTASGPVSWGKLYSIATGEVIQGGSRRGALMLMLNIDHPDIEEFITVKETPGLLENANLSVCISDDFMRAVQEDQPWPLRWNGESVKVVQARAVWNQICESAWKSGEPGVVFLERYNKLSNTWYFEEIISVNPCGEQGLPSWGVCNLGAINLTRFAEDGTIRWEELGESVRTAVRFLDNVIDATEYFYPENEDAQKKTRRTGLGTMGLGDLLLKLKIRYGSPKALAVCEEIFRFIRDHAYQASAELAKEKGPFPHFDREKYPEGRFIQTLPPSLREDIQRSGIRNAVLLTQAPTGTTSLLAGVSSGIEPVYDFAYVRRDRIGEHVIYHPLYKAWKDAHPDQAVPDYFVSANDLTPEEHVMMQAVIQKYTDSSISKTVNAPERHTPEEVKRLYLLAYDQGLKGITYFRDGSRKGVLSHMPDEEKSHMKVRPRVVEGKTYRVGTPIGPAYVTINNNGKGEPFEVFINVGKAGSDISAMSEAVGRLVSLVLRLPSALTTGEKVSETLNHLSGIGGSRSAGLGKDRVRSLPDAIARVLAEHIGLVHGRTNSAPFQDLTPNTEGFVKGADICPDCGHVAFVEEEGCRKCYACGFSEC